MLPCRCLLEDSHGQSAPWTSMPLKSVTAATLYALVLSLTLVLAAIIFRTVLPLLGFSEIRSWYGISLSCTLVLHILSFFLEKCVHGVPFQSPVCWICSVVYYGWWIDCGGLWDGFGYVYTHVWHGFRGLFYSY